jgi:hypothetical protein
MHEMTSAIPRAKLETAFLESEKDHNGASIVMAPMLTKLRHDRIDNFRFPLEVLILRIYRDSIVDRSTFVPIVLKISVSNFSRDDQTSFIHYQFRQFVSYLFSVTHIEYFYFYSFRYFHVCNPMNDQPRDSQPITVIEILEP